LMIGKDAAKALTALKQPGTYQIRLANVDEQLVLWVNNELAFEKGISYSSPARRVPTKFDLQPASIGIRSASVAVSHLKLWRDTYYIDSVSHGDGRGDYSLHSLSEADEWQNLPELKPFCMYVHKNPDHYLCMGDNSAASSDGRNW